VPEKVLHWPGKEVPLWQRKGCYEVPGKDDVYLLTNQD
jgi:hypothetical protein